MQSRRDTARYLSGQNAHMGPRELLTTGSPWGFRLKVAQRPVHDAPAKLRKRVGHVSACSLPDGLTHDSGRCIVVHNDPDRADLLPADLRRATEEDLPCDLPGNPRPTEALRH